MPGASPEQRFWEGFFGTRIAPGLAVVPHAALAGYRGVWFFARGEARIVSAPPEWCEPLDAALRGVPLDPGPSEPGLRTIFGDAFELSVGPSWLGWLAPTGFRPVHSEAVRPADARVLARLKRAAPSWSWQDAALCEQDAFAWCEGEEVLAAASTRGWGEGVVGPGVLSLRAGCGRAVASAACAQALARGDRVVYQTLRANEAAVGLARRLGVTFDASHLAVRLREERSGEG